MKKKLTPKQNRVINCLQHGWILATNSSAPGAWVCGTDLEFRINNRLFWNLVDLGLIYQSLDKRDHFNFMLTKYGREIKTVDTELTKQGQPKT